MPIIPSKLIRLARKVRMPWPAYAFDRYQRARHAFCLRDLSGLRSPGVPGLVSIVLPVFNGAAYLAEAVESVLAQTYPDFELIAVDDGSTDATPQILAEAARRDPRVQVLTQPNQKLPRALNNGFRQARGEFLTWTSADNRLKPAFLEQMTACLHRHPDWDLAYANQDLIDEAGRPLRGSAWFLGHQQPPGSEHIHLPHDPSLLNLVADNYIGGAFLYRDRVPALVGEYSPHRFGTEDYDYWMRVNALLSLRHADFPGPVYEYRFHSTSLTSRDEELGITRSRAGLMIFEEARRNFALVPLAWAVEADDGPAEALAAEIQGWARRASHIVQEPGSLDQGTRLWHPLVCLKILSGGAPGPVPTAWPEAALKVLVWAGPGELPAAVDPGWDLCLAVSGHGGPLSRLAGGWRGWLAADSTALLCSAIDIRARAFHLARLEAEAAAPPEPIRRISVVVSTYRRTGQLAGALSSLAAQTLPPSEVEILVVNNDPADPSVRAMVERTLSAKFDGDPDRLRYLESPFRGLSFARNAGLSEARGEIVAFLDDDAEALPNWLEQVLEAYRHCPRAGVVGGTIRVVPPEPRPGCFKPGWEKYWSQFTPAGPEPGQAEAAEVDLWWRFPWGANWTARRKALVEIGGFRGTYGRQGANFGGGEELIAGLLIRRLGYGVVVAPAAGVRHLPGRDRFTCRHVWRTIMVGKRSEYNEQVDLYLPMRLGPVSTFINLLRHLRDAFLKPGRYAHQRLESLATLWAEIALLVPYLQDQLRRFRRPYVLK